MKFFTPEACDTFYDSEPFQKIDAAYRRHLETLRGDLSDRVLQLAQPSGIEDGLVVRVTHDQEKRMLCLVLRCGHLQMGYYNLVLTYGDAALTPEHYNALATVAQSTKSQSDHGCDLAYHELDYVDGAIEHRLIFNALQWQHPTAGGYIWFAIRCRDLRWKRVPRRTRRFIPGRRDFPQISMGHAPKR